MRYLLLGLLAGCFREPDGSSVPLELRLSDLSGVIAASDDAPRDLELSLSFAGAPDDVEPLLMRGRIDATLLPRLSFARPNAALSAQLVKLDVERAPHALRGHPSTPLAPGPYTLVWPVGSEPRAYPFVVSSSPAMGARWVESAPGDGATRVPANLARALVRFDGHVQGPLATALHGDGFALTLERCGAYGLPEGDCAWFTPVAPLAAGRHTLVLEAGLFTPGGAAISAQRTSFEVVAEQDRVAPSLMVAHCAADERFVGGACLRGDDSGLVVRGLLDEPCLVTLLAGGQRAMALSYAGAFALSVSPPAPGVATLRLSDLAGNVRELALAFELPRLASVMIDEVRLDPLGPEPAQEYVELLNFGSETVSLMGFTLSTDALGKGRTVTSGTLAPGERALLVGPDFDARDVNDGALPSGLKVVPLSAALSLSNSGGELFLRDEQGRRLASARTLAPLVEGQCTHHVGERLRAGDWELDARGGCTPGADSP